MDTNSKIKGKMHRKFWQDRNMMTNKSIKEGDGSILHAKYRFISMVDIKRLVKCFIALQKEIETCQYWFSTLIHVYNNDQVLSNIISNPRI